MNKHPYFRVPNIVLFGVICYSPNIIGNQESNSERYSLFTRKEQLVFTTLINQQIAHVVDAPAALTTHCELPERYVDALAGGIIETNPSILTRWLRFIA